MLKKIIKYKDYNDQEQEKTFFFNLTRTEVSKLELSTKGGLRQKIEKIIEDKDGEAIMKVVDELIMLSYGEKDVDGRFVKSPELSKAFSETVAYDEMFMELIMSADKTSTFIEAILPKVAELPQTN